MDALTLAVAPDGVYSVTNTLPASAGLPPFALPARLTSQEAQSYADAMARTAGVLAEDAAPLAWRRIGFTTVNGRRVDAFRAILPTR